jgi:tRNA-intron endonuclease
LSELAKCRFADGRGTMVGPDADRVHQQGSVGEFQGGTLTLTGVEVLYLIEREKIGLVDPSGKRIEFPSLVEALSAEDPEAWLRFLLYSDLRRRGYIVKTGYSKGLEYRVYRRGAEIGKEPAKYLVVGLVEGNAVPVQELASIANSAKLSQKDLILAVIDRQGEITYYDASEVTL